MPYPESQDELDGHLVVDCTERQKDDDDAPDTLLGEILTIALLFLAGLVWAHLILSM